MHAMIHLHGIIRPPAADPDKAFAAADAARVELVAHRHIAAIVSPAGPAEDGESDEISQMRRLRREMGTHVEILNSALWADALVPVRFGTDFPDETTLIEEFLGPCYDAVIQALDRVDGAAEVKVSAECDRDRLLREVTRREPALVAASSGGKAARAALDDRIELGRHVVAAIEARRDEMTADILERLSPCAREVALREPTSELSALNASFLVDRAEMDAFDREVGRWAGEADGRVRLTCLGPLPPYSFVDLRIGESC
jgi:Gas vesicle synthesis protein GvpL/GvpF